MDPVIVVHGGASQWELGSSRLREAVDACEAAVAQGLAVLTQGGSALDAVEAAVHILEDCPATDAGVGSHLNTNGEVEMDALIMDGQNLDAGAVAAVQRVKHPISLARRVMEDSPHALLVAHGAETFAEKIGFPRCEAEELLVGYELERYRALVRDGIVAQGKDLVNPDAPGDTVGAVALDVKRNLAVATSTGGTEMKLPGRVGDSPIVGSGGYADNETAAVGATGHGEAILKVLLSRRVCDFVAQGLPAQAACNAAMMILESRVGGRGGLIAIDFIGRIGYAFNTRAMPYAYGAGSEPIVSGH